MAFQDPTSRNLCGFLQHTKRVVLACLALAFFVDFIQISPFTSKFLHRTLLSLSTPYQQCGDFSVTSPSKPIIPTYAASYPGSGSQVAHYLYEAITGLEAGDEDLHRGDTYDKITIETKFPARPQAVKGDRLMSKVILLLRNPLYSIPSYHNSLYGEENGIPTHTVEAPLESWVQWRDDHISEQIERWRDHTDHWLQNYNGDDRLVISYERLTDRKMGPIESARISNFLSRQEGVDVVAPSQLPCIWDKVVNYSRIDFDKDGNEISTETARKLQAKRESSNVSRRLYREDGKELYESKGMVRRRVKYVSREDPTTSARIKRSGIDVYPFKLDHLLELKAMLESLRRKYVFEYTFESIISGYIEEINDEVSRMKH